MPQATPARDPVYQQKMQAAIRKPDGTRISSKEIKEINKRWEREAKKGETISRGDIRDYLKLPKAVREDLDKYSNIYVSGSDISNLDFARVVNLSDKVKRYYLNWIVTHRLGPFGDGSHWLITVDFDLEKDKVIKSEIEQGR